jgi:hypothetical protein
VLNLTWTGNNAGTFTFTPTGGAPESGTFTVTDIPPVVDPPDPTNDPGTNPPPSSLSGRVLQISYPSTGGGERFTFTSDTAVTYEDPSQGISGTYTYDQAAGRISAIMNNGWQFTITLTPNSNAATVVFQDGGAPPETLNATYTLTP